MVRIISLAAGFLALVVSTEACHGYFQCKNTDGSHCYVRLWLSKTKPLSCLLGQLLIPNRLSTVARDDGASANWEPECISTLVGNKRHLYVFLSGSKSCETVS
ncbi:hypothetical protein COCHEDRAFT_1118557 [Bipolaris maydis C5]|uniref:Secreted protein n=1 Tax=Cochliobolus heterostrophus (strain C5 / ATCC 48332 / race O) TaxID=701091 RepID=M2TUY4_COCH5|nr:hypothetical protein COCHEDRAFT_1118557 [Bipolaris maydis C5]KAJ5055517.1 hypothetical protein J3E74DRAFT_227225 [Bipolaris maydis]KAJ6204151.1 hypothetical protein PSV09DRAFT_1118557 [Bipolaris maydis]